LPILAAFLFLFAARPAQPSQFHVAPDGSDVAAGTAASPLKTLAEAARRAGAGDIVTIQPGMYEEGVSVAGSGMPGQPILFQAAEPGSVIITGENSGFQPALWAGDHDDFTASGNPWVTLRGLTFRNIGARPAVRAGNGWRIEDCRFEQIGFGINIRGSDVTVERSVFRDIESPNAHAIVGVGGRNLHLSDLVIQRVNHRKLIADVANSAVTKFIAINGLTVERLVSEDNVGPGLWLDTNNSNFVIRNNVIRHNAGDGVWWQGPGLWIEQNPAANGQIYGNTVIGNSGVGIEVMESSGLDIRDNLLLDNPVCISFRNLPRGGSGKSLIGAIQVHGNLCGGWTAAGITTGIGDWRGFDPIKNGVRIDGNRYLSASGQPLILWLDQPLRTLAEAAEFGFEQHGFAQ
jgi:parallel beta-helix repeat protein